MSKIGEIIIGQEVIWFSRLGKEICTVIDITKLDKPYIEPGLSETVDFIFKVETNEEMPAYAIYVAHKQKAEFASIQLNPVMEFQNINWSGGPGTRGFIFSSEEKFKECKNDLREMHRRIRKNEYDSIMKNKELYDYEALSLLGVV